MEPNAYQYPHIYKELGININKLGYVTLQLEPWPFGDLEDLPQELQDTLSIKTDKERKLISPHVTLLYGLLHHKDCEHYAKDVLAGAYIPREVFINGLSVFNQSSQYCVHYTVRDPARDLDKLRHRLELLPHINTYATYKPHITVGYINKSAIQPWTDFLRKNAPYRMQVTGLDLGDES